MMLVISCLIFIALPFFLEKMEETEKLGRYINKISLVLVLSVIVFMGLENINHSQHKGITFALFLLGILLFYGVERIFHHNQKGATKSLILVSVLGLIGHTMMDGLVLGLECKDHESFLPIPHHDHGAHILGWGVIFHRIPFTLFIWKVLRTVFTSKLSYSIMAVFAFFTYLGSELHSVEAFKDFFQKYYFFFEALILGSLAHSILDPFFHKHSHSHEDHGPEKTSPLIKDHP